MSASATPLVIVTGVAGTQATGFAFKLVAGVWSAAAAGTLAGIAKVNDWMTDGSTVYAAGAVPGFLNLGTNAAVWEWTGTLANPLQLRNIVTTGVFTGTKSTQYYTRTCSTTGSGFTTRHTCAATFTADGPAVIEPNGTSITSIVGAPTIPGEAVSLAMLDGDLYVSVNNSGVTNLVTGAAGATLWKAVEGSTPQVGSPVTTCAYTQAWGGTTLANAGYTAISCALPNPSVQGFLAIKPPNLKRDVVESGDTAAWSFAKVWDVKTDYEADDTVGTFTSAGPIEVHDGKLYWSTSEQPLMPGFVHLLSDVFGIDAPAIIAALIGGTPLPTIDPTALTPDQLTGAADALWNAHRATTLFRASSLGEGTDDTELLVGQASMPAYDPTLTDPLDPLSPPIGWVDTPNKMGGATPTYATSGYGNFFNSATTSMLEHNGELLIGTMDWSGVIPQVLLGYLTDTLAASSPALAQIVSDYLAPESLGFGADVFRLGNDSSEYLKAEALDGLGNQENWSVPAMVSTGGPVAYAGMANPMNRDASGGWEVRKLYTDTSAPGPPTLIAPTGVTTDTTPTFTWTDATDADGDTVSYRLQVQHAVLGSCVDFAFPSINTSEPRGTTYTPKYAMADGLYCWRVLGTDSVQDGPWSSVGSFRIDTTAPTIGITFPANGATYTPTQWRAGCISPIGENACGSATDLFGSGIDKVELKLTRASDGKWWTNASGGSFVNSGPEWFLPNGSIVWWQTFPSTSMNRDETYTLTAHSIDVAGNGSGDKAVTFTIVRAASTLLYDGSQLVVSTVTTAVNIAPRGRITSPDPLCLAGRTVTFTAKNVATHAAAGTTPSSVTVSDGVTAPVTLALPPGVYEVTASVPASFNCMASEDTTTVVVAGPGDSANGAGSYTAKGYGRIDFGLNAKKMKDGSYTGTFILRTPVKDTPEGQSSWRIKGVISAYSVDSAGFGQLSGTVDISRWNSSGWVQCQASVPYLAQFLDIAGDTAHVKKGGTKASADKFGLVQLKAATACAGFPLNTLSTATTATTNLSALKKGDIRAS
jgi:hypothetical protein